jgi:hypothetical protein
MSELWKRKLMAFLHDTPTKALDIRSHEERADAAAARAGADVWFDKSADHLAASSDRIPFPSSKASGLSCSFNGVDNQFHHPLGGQARYQFPFPFASTGQAEECEQVVQPGQLTKLGDWNNDDAQRADFFAHWRLWPDWLNERDARCAFLPADTRIPDHTIFNHCSVTSAFAGVQEDEPAFLRFHLGPVQAFIAAARSTRDLWSGSFLISWLITTGLKKLSECVGPDAVIFPNLNGQPLFDFLWRDQLWGKMKSHVRSNQTIWDGFHWSQAAILTPNFPNTFLALVPRSQAAELASKVEDAICDEWQKIANAVWLFAVKESKQDNRELFDRQVAHHLAISWQVTPFPKTLGDAEKIIQETLPDREILHRFQTVRQTFEQDIPQEHRDKRYYSDAVKSPLNNIGLAWSLIVAFSAWQLDAVRQTRAFSGWSVGGASENRGKVKDALNGREEALFYREIKATMLTNDALGEFDYDDPVGATTLIKRVWHKAYLLKNFGFNSEDFKMPNTRGIALNTNWDKNKDDAKYFAVIAFDGDDMGKWVSGEKAPHFGSQLADYTENGERKGAKVYFENKVKTKSILTTPRPVTPSYHLQFSQALSNFAVHIVPRIVQAHGGRLIYAGGDDVLAMLPAVAALACADDLQRAFSGKSPRKSCGVKEISPGFLSIKEDQNRNPIPLLVPGSAATASCGIAMAHFKEPLQDVVREAQDSEKRAKKHFKEQNEKNAFAVSVCKHSGEISQWTASFKEEKAAFPAYSLIMHAMGENIVSDKFPHRLLEFIAPYRSSGHMKDASDFDFTQAATHDLDLTLDRQRGTNYNTAEGKDIRQRLCDAVSGYLKNLSGTTTEKHDQFAGLLTVAAFLARQPQEKQ